MAKGSGYKFVNLVTALPLQDKANTFMFVKESMWCELVVTRIWSARRLGSVKSECSITDALLHTSDEHLIFH